jgi:hypothetical protein
LGFCENTRDIQQLINSMINIGFDSLKICSMDIIVVDETKIKDPTSIEYKPLAVWKVNGDPRAAVNMTRQGISALGQILQGLTLLDQFDQEASGVLRATNGASEIGGSSTQTLGEYNAKLSMVDNRFLQVGRFIERDYVEPLLKKTYKILTNEKMFSQESINAIIGTDTVDVPVLDQSTQTVQVVQAQVPRLDMTKLRMKDFSLNFRANGMTQFSKSAEAIGKLKEALTAALTNPDLKIMTNIKELWTRILQTAEIGDSKSLMKTDEEIQNIIAQMSGGQNGMMQDNFAQDAQVNQQPQPQGGFNG